MKCYCCSNENFASCCQPFIQNRTKPDTPEQLMRSRYSAFCDENADYLVATQWPLAPTNRATIQKTIDATHWIGLKVIASRLDLNDQSQAEVEFVAFYDEDGVQQLHELSRFSRKDGQWYYLNGQQLAPIKLARNDP